MPPPSLKLPTLLDLDVGDDVDAAAATLDGGTVQLQTITSCVISSPTCVRSLSKAVNSNNDNVGGDGRSSSSSVNIEYGQEEAVVTCGQQKHNVNYSQSEITEINPTMPGGMVTEVGRSFMYDASGPAQNHAITMYSTPITASSITDCEEPTIESNSSGAVPRGQNFTQSQRIVVSNTTTGAPNFEADGTVRDIPQTTPTPQTTTCTMVAPTAPIIFVGITLERPETVNSWGLVFVKDKGGHALIVRVVPPTTEGPVVKWCQITSTVPNPSVVYRSQATSAMTFEQYESFTVRNFPPPSEDNGMSRHDNNNPMLVPYLMPGDAILSVNGIPVSALDLGQLASYIRGICQRNIIIVVMRHETVMKAMALIATTPPTKFQDQQQDIAARDRASATIKEAWMKILSTRGVIGQQQQVKRKLGQPNSRKAKRPKINYNNVAFQSENGKPIPYCDNYDIDPDDGKRIHGVS